MYIIKNALSNLVRNKRRNVLVGVISLTVIFATTISIVINTTTKEIINDYKGRFGSEVAIDIDINKINQMAQTGELMFDIENITADKYMDFADSDYLKSYSLKGSIGIDFKGEIKPVGQDDADEMGDIFIAGNGMEGEEDPTMSTGNAYFINNISQLDEFKNGRRSIVEGKVFTEKNEILVSEDFAKLNNLKVGSEIKVKGGYNLKNKEENLKIAGIYKDLTEEYSGMPIKVPGMNRRNDIIMSLESDFAKNCLDEVYIEANYELKNPDLLEKFKVELDEKGLPEVYKASTDEATYNKIIAPVLGLEEITKTSMLAILIVGGIILLLVQSITVRERKYEIGVLRAMGMKKNNIARMFIYENLLITSICLLIGFTVGNVLSQNIADSLIESQVKIAEENSKNNFMNYGMDGVVIGGEAEMSIIGEVGNEAEVLSNIDVQLSMESIFKILAVSLVIVIFTSLIGVIAITRYEPMQILSERN